MDRKVKIFNVNLETINIKEFKIIISKNFINNKICIAKINTEFLVRASKDPKFQKTLNNFNLNIVDGIGVQWAAKYLSIPISKIPILRQSQAIFQMIYSGTAIIFHPKFIKNPISERIPGIEALNIMIATAEKNNASVFFFGSSEETITKTVKEIQKKYPKLIIAGYLNGYDYQKNSSINPVKIINESQAKMLIVAQGSPRQEYWIAENMSKLKFVKIAVGEGGTLDRIANHRQASPKWINKIGLEWLWRFFFNKSTTVPVNIGEKRNNFHRLWNSVPFFVYEVVKWKLKNA